MAATELSEPFTPEKSSSSDLVEGFNSLNLFRQAGLMIGLAASVAIGFWVVLWTQGEDYRPLYGSTDHLDAAEVGRVLDFNEISYKIDIKTGALLVVADDVHTARIKLAEAGMSGSSTMGFELLDQEQPLGTSQFMESARYRRSLEGELSRTISSIQPVRSARVHLAIPKASVFVRDGRKPSASVFLEMFPGRTLDPHQVRGIANLIASSIPQMQAENVSIVDQKGALISMGMEDQDLIVAAQHIDYTRKIENDIVSRIHRLLGPVVGDGNFKTEVSADIDFTEIEQAEESFNPELPALRSESTVSEQQVNGKAPMGVPGALSNQPPASGEAPELVEGGGGARAEDEASPSNVRQQATRNFELDRTVSYTKHQKGRLKRLSLAVVLNHKSSVDAETGERVRTPWNEEEITRLTSLVRDAVGYDAQRGDSVNIISEAFFDLEEIEMIPTPWFENDVYKFWAKQGLGLLIIVILLVGFLRPVLKSIAASGTHARSEEEAKEIAALEAAGVDSFDSLSNETVTLTGGDSLALPSPEESYEQQLNAVKGLVADDPTRVAQVIKRWINEE